MYMTLMVEPNNVTLLRHVVAHYGMNYHKRSQDWYDFDWCHLDHHWYTILDCFID